MTILETIQSSVEEVLGVDPLAVQPDVHIISGLDADSLEMVELVMVMEEKLGIEIPDEDAARLVTVGDWVEYLTKRTQIATEPTEEASKL